MNYAINSLTFLLNINQTTIISFVQSTWITSTLLSAQEYCWWRVSSIIRPPTSTWYSPEISPPTAFTTPTALPALPCDHAPRRESWWQKLFTTFRYTVFTTFRYTVFTTFRYTAFTTFRYTAFTTFRYTVFTTFRYTVFTTFRYTVLQ